MIVYDLSCSGLHRFEGWFPSLEAFESQKASGLLTCPLCGVSDVERLPSAVYVSRGSDEPGAPRPPEPAAGENAPLPAEVQRQFARLAALVRHVVEKSENVGSEFPAEARRIHYGDAPERSIRGVASRQDAEDLREEGIDVLQLPIPSTDEVH